MKYTDAQIKAIGGKRYLKKKMKRILLALGLSLAWVPLLDFMTTQIAWWVYFAPMVIVVGNIIISFMQARNAFYKKVKADPSILQ